ncbi:hypothetical protein M758_11G009400 [Ceratodon purpureus]|uniref:Uncharacterized protein n=1 Tax=Ceratodon purpureus TaxID=3225 RepID=A0A8T0GB13_CERPU|nr:hypothetical protein KC19_11G011100 [Ceratodon purpureus]KAG0600133.1 hypothetical protein M758_11G009400 [Ceratodon purpureus]
MRWGILIMISGSYRLLFCWSVQVIASFLGLLYDYVGIATHKQVVPDEVKGRIIHHSFPMTVFVPKEEKCDVKSLKRLQDWTWQFVILRPVLSIIVMFLEWMGWYVGPIAWIVTIVLNVSVSLAMYSLVLFYHLFHAELAPHKPLAKILCIKGVVFFSFWQGVVLQLLATAGIIRSEHIWLEVSQIEEAYQNLFVCVEMVAFAVIQQYAFGVQEYSGDLDKLLADAQRRREKKDH